MNTESNKTPVPEGEILSQAQGVIAGAEDPKDPLLPEFKALTENYRQLLDKFNQANTGDRVLRENLNEKLMELEKEKLRSENNLESLIEIGNALSIEKDRDTLLRTILALSRKMTGADAGSIFLVESDNDGSKILRFRYSHTCSKELPYEEFTIPFDTKSIAGYVAVTGRILNIPDVYTLTEDDPVSFNHYFDDTFKYRTKSMLVVPMRNHYDVIIGVLQLLNRKNSRCFDESMEPDQMILQRFTDYEYKVIPFDTESDHLVQAIASQAAIALENNRMIKQIELQFEQFAKASVTAIESRDPATSGHSFRVADMCVKTALAINRDTGVYREISFSETELKELHYAGLLHDFGKVYVDQSIFLKAKKLFTRDFDNLMLRLTLLHRSLELESAKRHTSEDRVILPRLEKLIGTLVELNEPSITNQDPDKTIKEILEFSSQFKAVDLSGDPVELLTPEDISNLTIPRGTLNAEERKIIESHVEHTYAFVSKIPWPEELKNIPEIARKHHEKLDGSGYPLGLRGTENNPLQSRIMAIADLFDALAAADRPYKKAVPLKVCFSIMRKEAAENKLDSNLVELFISSEAYKTDQEPETGTHELPPAGDTPGA